MLGVRAERHADFKRWSDSVIATVTGSEREHRFASRNTAPMFEMMAMIQAIARERRAEPRDDLISTIVAEQGGEVGLSDREVVQFVILLLVAGNETTTNLIGNVTHALLENPDVLRAAAADPSKIAALVDEGLRYDSPVQSVFRTATADTEIRGVRIPKGEYVGV